MSVAFFSVRLATHHRPVNVKLPGVLRHLTLLYIYIYWLICGTLHLVEFAAWYLQNKLLCCVSLALKMAQKKLCPRTPKKKKKSSGHGGRPPAILTATAPMNFPQGPVGQVTQNTSRTDSHHHNQKLNQWVVQKMKNALEEWHYWEDAYCLTYWFGCCPWRLPSSCFEDFTAALGDFLVACFGDFTAALGDFPVALPLAFGDFTLPLDSDDSM